MKLLAEISDASLGLSHTEILGRTFELRKSARAIIRKPDGTIAVQYLQNHFLHKFPGGGVEIGETIEEGLVREIKEEVGCEVRMVEPLGLVIEYREQHSLIHLSYCYVADIVGEVGAPNLEQAEIDEGMVTLWLTPQDALQKMNTDTPNTYQGPFISMRERTFLKEYLVRHT